MPRRRGGTRGLPGLGREDSRGTLRALLHELVDLLEENIDELARLESQDAGKPIAVARGEELPGIVGGAVSLRRRRPGLVRPGRG